jgi:PAS domain S-box-containing protein
MEEPLQLSVEDLGAIFDALPDAVTVQDPTGRLVYANDAAARTIGYPSPGALLSAPLEEIVGRFELRDEHGNPLRVELLPGRIALSGREAPETVVRFRTRGSDDEQWAVVKASPVFDAGGRIRLVVNIFRDVTRGQLAVEQVRAGARYQAAVAHLGQRALEGVDLDELLDQAVAMVAGAMGLELVDVRQLAPETDGIMVRAAVGLDVMDGASEQAGQGTQAGYVLASSDPVEVSDLAADDRFAPSSLLLRNEARSGILARIESKRPSGILEAFSVSPRTFAREDVHFVQSVANILGTTIERDGAERERAELLERERRARAEAEAMQWGLAFLAVGSNVLSGSLNVETTLANVARLAVPSFADWCVVHLLQDDGSLKEVALAHAEQDKVEQVMALQRRYPPAPDVRRGPAAVAKTGRSEIYPDIPPELLVEVAQDEDHLELLQGLGLDSAMVVPLLSRGRTLGTLTFAAAESGRRYGEIDLTLAEDLGRRAGLAVDNARLYEASARVAATLQRSLLPPELPTIPGLEVAARFRPAGRGDEIGGDFYDLFETGDRSWAVVIGDVCGKGADAAAVTGLARHTIRAAAIHDSRPSQVLATLNQALIRQVEEQRFCTVSLVRLRPGSRAARLTISSGGHPLPLLLRADGTTERVGRPGSLLGVFEDAELHDEVVDLHAADTLVLFTDGVVEEHVGETLFGEDRLASILAASRGETAATIADRIERAVLSFQPENSRDDVAVVVLRVLP